MRNFELSEPHFRNAIHQLFVLVCRCGLEVLSLGDSSLLRWFQLGLHCDFDL
jgi:hypothetical protein